MKTFDIEIYPIFGISLGAEYVPETDESSNESAFVADVLFFRIVFFWHATV